MNTIYRIVWNRALGEWTAVSELAKCQGAKGAGVDASSHGLRRMAFAIACVLGGTMACMPAVYASSPESGQRASLHKVSPRLADLSDLLAKYGNAEPDVVQRVAPRTVAKAMAPRRVPSRVARQPAATLAVAESHSMSVPSSVRQAGHAIRSRVDSQKPAGVESVRSPQLASNAQIAAALEARATSSSAHVGAASVGHVAHTWVVGSDGSLHVNASTRADAAIAHAAPVRGRPDALPAVPHDRAATRTAADNGKLHVRQGRAPQPRMARVQATPPPVPAIAPSQPVTNLAPHQGTLQVDASATAIASAMAYAAGNVHVKAAPSEVPSVPAVTLDAAVSGIRPSGGLAQVGMSLGAVDRSRMARVEATPSLPPMPAMTTNQPLARLVPVDGSLVVGAKAKIGQVGLTHGIGQMHVQAVPALPEVATTVATSSDVTVQAGGITVETGTDVDSVTVASVAAPALPPINSAPMATTRQVVLPRGRLATLRAAAYADTAPATMRTTGATLNVDSVHDAVLLASLGAVRYNPANPGGAPAGAPASTGNVTTASTSADPFSAAAGGSGFRTASVGTAQRFAPLAASMMAPRMAVAPMAADTVGVPTVPPPGNTPTGLIVSNGGVVGAVPNLLGTSLNGLLDNSDPNGYIVSGGLKVSNANFTQGYGVVNVLGIPLVNTTPVGDLLTDVSGTLVGGTGINSHLTLIGGVTSGNYIKNINNGAAGGLLGLVAPDSAPAWASKCLDLLGLGLVTQDCWGVNAAQDYQVLVGDGATANGSKEVVIGTGASHTLPVADANTVFPGDGRNDPNNPSGVPTADYEARLGHSVVIGDEASGTANAQTILGAEATSSVANSVALGYKSAADRGAMTGYTNAYGLTGIAQNSVGVVSIGSPGNERQITNVAAGTDDYDAVNVAQLKGAINGVSGSGVLAVKYDDDGTGNPANNVTLVGDGTGATVGITNVAPGAVTPTSTDAVNGSQLSDTNTTVAQYFGGTTNYDGTTNTWTPPDFQITNIDNSGNVTVGDYDNVNSAFDALNTSVTNIYNNGVKYFHANSTLTDGSATGTNAIAVGPLADASAEDAIAIGNGATADKAGSIALGAGSATTVGAQTDYTAYALKTKQTSAGEVNIGNRKITGVAAGSAANDAVNVAQLEAVAGSVGDLSNLVVKYDADPNDMPTNHITLTGDGTGTPVGISQLAAGELSAVSTDAVNGAQLFGTNTMIATYFGGSTAFDGATSTWTPPDFSIVNIDQQGKVTTGHYDNVTAAFDALNASLLNVNNKGGGNSKYFDANSTGAAADASGTESVAMGGDTVASGAGTVAAGSGAQATTDGAVAIGHNATASGGQAVAIGPGAVATGDGAVSIGDPNVATGTGVVALGKDNTASGTGAVALGNATKATGTGVVALGNQSQATADGAVAIGNGASSSVKNGVAIGTDSVADRANTVSVGSAGNERQITNVAAGTANTDAVNVAQLKASQNGTVRYDTTNNGTTVNYKSITLGKPGGGGSTTVIHNVGPGKDDHDAVNVKQLRGVKNWARNYTDQRVGHFMRQLNQVGDNAYAGVASAMAMAGLPQAYLPGKNMAAVAGGTFHGESSLAIGMSMISDNGHWVFKLSGSTDTQGDAGASVGVGIQW